ncbi:MAG TPA: aminotransferase class V-fold PLP-dependent enzyme [Verrucomicrobiae bacterium]|nr:aminotransferase class V-fold PLP-dependent enzyme [Verrucomicrobiae bacterium]
MTIQELHSNEELRLHEFPVARKTIFLGHAGVCPLPRGVAEAMKRFNEQCTQGDQEESLPPGFFSGIREKACRLVSAKPEEIAFVGPTSLALSFIAGGLKFRKTDNVLIYQDDYPSNVYPWMTLAQRGIQVRYLNVKELGKIRLTDIKGQVDENTRLVALASCHFLAGYRIDLEAIGKFLRERGILFCVDAIQTLGAFPTSMEYVDFAAADAHKWMLGPCAAGLMYVRNEVQDQLLPTTHGWHNIRCPNYVAQERLNYRTDARRYEAGTANLVGLAGLGAAMDLLLEIGIESIAAEALRKRAWIVPELQAKGYEVLQANAAKENQGAMISFHKQGADLAAVHQKLKDANILISLRGDRSGRKLLRISPHFYNTDSELKRVLDML